jgi:hypothetical protein
MHRKYKRLKLGGGQAYGHSADYLQFQSSITAAIFVIVHTSDKFQTENVALRAAVPQSVKQLVHLLVNRGIKVRLPAQE